MNHYELRQNTSLSNIKSQDELLPVNRLQGKNWLEDRLQKP